MNNLIGDILSTVKFNSAVYFKHGFCSPWGMDIPKGNLSQFHLVSSGSCLLIFGKKTTHLEKGDIVILPDGAPHQIKDHNDSICKPGQKVVTNILNGKKPFRGKTESTQLICGHYEMDQEVSHPVFEKLPKCIVIKSSEYGRFDLIYSIFELLVEEMNLKKAGYETVSLRLAEILFISIIRHYYLNQSKDQLNLFKDELVFNAIDLIHKKLGEEWSIEKLARQAGVSRTLFIDRFKKAVGEPPMKYVANWRLTKAKFLLKNTSLPLAQISEQIGYLSETSFNRAFKHKYNISPGKFRVKKEGV